MNSLNARIPLGAPQLSSVTKRRLGLAAIGLSACYLAAALFQFISTGVDARFAAAWGEELFYFDGPNFDGAVPAKHPLTLALGVLAAPFGTDQAMNIFGAISLASLALLGFAGWRLGRLLGGPVAGWIVLVLMVTRPEVVDQAISAGKDLPFAALVLLALSYVLESTTQRWRLVMGLLVLAGLMRPEAWPLAVGFGIWVLRAEPPGTPRATVIALAVAAPVIWVLIDLLLTGNPIHTFEQLRDKPDARLAEGAANAATNEGGGSTLKRVIDALYNGLPGVIGWPLLVGGALGGISAGRRLGSQPSESPVDGQFRGGGGIPRLARAVAILAALIAVVVPTIAVTVVGLPIDDRFLLTVSLLTVALIASAWLLRDRSRLAQAGLVIGVLGTVVLTPFQFGDIVDAANRNRELDRQTGSLLSLARSPQIRQSIDSCPALAVGGAPRLPVQVGRATLALELDRDLEALPFRRGRILSESATPSGQAGFGFRVTGQGLAPPRGERIRLGFESRSWQFVSTCTPPG